MGIWLSKRHNVYVVSKVLRCLFHSREVIFLFLPEGRVVVLLYVFLCNCIPADVAIVNMTSPKVRVEVPCVFCLGFEEYSLNTGMCYSIFPV